VQNTAAATGVRTRAAFIRPRQTPFLVALGGYAVTVKAQVPLRLPLKTRTTLAVESLH
jgi:hypothetical protein